MGSHGGEKGRSGKNLPSCGYEQRERQSARERGTVGRAKGRFDTRDKARPSKGGSPVPTPVVGP